LSRGGVRIIVMHLPIEGGASFDAWLTGLLQRQALVTMVSEMPYLAAEWFLKKVEHLGFAASHGAFAVQKFKTPPKIDAGVIIYETWGKTEAKVLNGSVDFGMEITQSGSAIKNYGLVIAEEVMVSETGIWANPKIKDNPEKHELAQMFLLNLYGSIFAENKVLLFFNAHQEQVPAVLDYLREHRLFGDEPTMNEGPNYTEFSIQLDAQSKELPLARVRYELARLGATYIETVPLDSCIPGINAISF
jgi:ATP phosphoribosyltransferase